MSDTEPNGYELQRSIDRVDKSLATGLADIKIILASLVSRDLFEAEKLRRDEQLRMQAAKIEELQAAQKDGLDTLTEALKEHTTGHSNRTWQFWVAIIAPVVSIAGSVIINVVR